MRWVLRLFSTDWRHRHGDEVLDALEHSDRPVRDHLNLIVTAAGLAGERTRTMQQPAIGRRLVTMAALGALLGTFALAWATTHLSNGLREVPQHWWSTAAALPLVLAGAIAASVALLSWLGRTR